MSPHSALGAIGMVTSPSVERFRGSFIGGSVAAHNMYTYVCMQAVGKLRLCREVDVVPKVDLNASQSASLLRKLTDK